MEKNELIAGIIGVIIIIVLTVFYVRQYQVGFSKSTGPSQLGITTSSDQSKTQIKLTLSEVQKHNTAVNCWAIVDKKVYDVTAYAKVHPGGVRRIDDYCGKDMTEAFLTKGGQGKHSQAADQQHAMLLLGPLDSTINSSDIRKVPDNTSQIKNIRGRYDD